MRIYATALGCKLNQNEAETLARRLHTLGHEVVQDPAQADICILNTCTVTHIASRKSRQALRRLRRENPAAFLVATGCYAEMAPEEKSPLGVDLVVDNANKDRLVNLLAEVVPGFELGCVAPAAPFTTFSPRTRAFVKIQDGCNNACTYCIVTKARGPARSRPADEVLAEIAERLSEGYREVVLTGVHIGCYGQERGDTLTALVQAILRETDVPRLRLSSIEPWDFTPALLEALRDPRVCRQLHLPLQSGCDATLRRMARKYTTAEYANLVASARRALPGLAVTTDIIVGFPGETDAEFEASQRFVRERALARLHVFKYSPRPGTLAAAMPDQVPPPVQEERSQAMHKLGAESAREFQGGLLGQAFDVLWETQAGEVGTHGLPVWSGLTDNYVRAFVESDEPLANVIRSARLVSLRKDGAWASLDPSETW